VPWLFSGLSLVNDRWPGQFQTKRALDKAGARLSTSADRAKDLGLAEGLLRFCDDTKGGVTEAQQFFERVIDVDSHYTVAHASVALCAGANEKRMDVRSSARDRASEKIGSTGHRGGRDDATALAAAGFPIAWIAGDPDEGAPFIDRALNLSATLPVHDTIALGERA